jgi:hypothetical protein
MSPSLSTLAPTAEDSKNLYVTTPSFVRYNRLIEANHFDWKVFVRLLIRLRPFRCQLRPIDRLPVAPPEHRHRQADSPRLAALGRLCVPGK